MNDLFELQKLQTRNFRSEWSACSFVALVPLRSVVRAFARVCVTLLFCARQNKRTVHKQPRVLPETDVINWRSSVKANIKGAALRPSSDRSQRSSRHVLCVCLITCVNTCRKHLNETSKRFRWYTYKVRNKHKSTLIRSNRFGAKINI